MNSKNVAHVESANDTETCHIVVRIGRNLKILSGDKDVIEAHNEMFTSHAAVSFGKFGKPLNTRIVGILNKQIADNKPTFLYLVRKAEAGFDAFRAPISCVTEATQAKKANPPSPNYAESNVATWLVISERFTETTIDDLYLRSNERPLLDVVSETRTPAMLVYS